MVSFGWVCCHDVTACIQFNSATTTDGRFGLGFTTSTGVRRRGNKCACRGVSNLDHGL